MFQQAGQTVDSTEVNGELRFPLPPVFWRRLSGRLKFTAREIEIVQLLFEGGNEPTIAEQLGVSTHTVHSHFDRIYRKVGVNTRCGLILRVFREYLELTAPSGTNQRVLT